VSYPNTCYRKVHTVRVRGVPEMALCLVFTPDNPEIFTLNPSAWLILQLCDGRSETEIAREYLSATEPALSPEDVTNEVRRGLASLVKQGIIEAVPSKTRRPKFDAANA
jgi:coenzyme PQQ synthesis protein D (PqqD)